MLRSFAFAALLGAATVASASTELKSWKGGATPPLAQATLDGGRVDLRDLQGRVVVVNFWATWCEPCRAEMPSFERLRERMRGRALEVITVNFGENPQRIRDFLQRQRIDLPVLLDPDKEAAAAWHAGGLPITFLVDAKGRVRYSAFGESDWSAGEALQVVEALVAEVPVAR